MSHLSPESFSFGDPKIRVPLYVSVHVAGLPALSLNLADTYRCHHWRRRHYHPQLRPSSSATPNAEAAAFSTTAMQPCRSSSSLDEEKSIYLLLSLWHHCRLSAKPLFVSCFTQDATVTHNRSPRQPQQWPSPLAPISI
ncbi:hypothetical protein GW17_00018487 [Ensete ventricosum]|nr:hypothetical protein GW17_00018487 [Ensete ventricosum]